MGMNQRTVARGLLAGAGLATAILLTACQGSSSAGSSPSSLDVTSTSTPAPTTSSSAAPTTSATQPGGSGGNGECKAANLKLSIGSGDAAAGHFYVPIVFTNTGSAHVHDARLARRVLRDRRQRNPGGRAREAHRFGGFLGDAGAATRWRPRW